MRKRRVTNARFAFAALALATIALPSLASAESGFRSWGPRIGYRLGEEGFDQFVLGVHADMGDVFTYTRFAPNIEVGWGGDATIVTLNPEFHYVWRDDPLGESTYFYSGGGVSLHFVDIEVDDELGDDIDPGVDDADAEMKINIAAGVETKTSETLGYFGEVRVFFIDGTWIEFMGGINLLR